MARSKLGIGVYNYDPKYVQDVVATRASCVLLFDNALTLAYDIKRADPGMLIVGRKWQLDGEQQIGLMTPGMATDLAHSLCIAFPEVDVWQAYNETGNQNDVFAVQAQAEIAFAQECARNGKQACVMNFCPGCMPIPGEGGWEQFVEIMRPLLATPGVGYLGYHSYGLADEQFMNGTNSSQWSTYRYRQLVDGLRSAGVNVPPVIITEYGQSNGFKQLDLNLAVNDFLAFGQQINNDYRVFGACDFLHGTVDPARWQNFNEEGTAIFNAIVQFNGGNIPNPQPQPSPSPQPQPGTNPGTSDGSGTVGYGMALGAAGIGIFLAWALVRR